MDVATAIAITAISFAFAWSNWKISRALLEAHRESLGMLGNMVNAATLRSYPPAPTIPRPTGSPLDPSDDEQEPPFG